MNHRFSWDDDKPASPISSVFIAPSVTNSLFSHVVLRISKAGNNLLSYPGSLFYHIVLWYSVVTSYGLYIVCHFLRFFLQMHNFNQIFKGGFTFCSIHLVGKVKLKYLLSQISPSKTNSLGVKDQETVCLEKSLAVMCRDGPWPNPSILLPAVNKWWTHLWPGYFLTLPDEIFLTWREKIENLGFLGEIF